MYTYLPTCAPVIVVVAVVIDVVDIFSAIQLAHVADAKHMYMYSWILPGVKITAAIAECTLSDLI